MGIGVHAKELKGAMPREDLCERACVSCAKELTRAPRMAVHALMPAACTCTHASSMPLILSHLPPLQVRMGSNG